MPPTTLQSTFEKKCERGKKMSVRWGGEGGEGDGGGNEDENISAAFAPRCFCVRVTYPGRRFDVMHKRV
jgi:hypothetical protein